MVKRAQEALDRLRAGNLRFRDGVQESSIYTGQARREELAEGQAPFAIILGCADSRAPAEIIFDQGPGDLFVVRVAGNIAAPSQVGSVEYAAEVLGAALVVVLGHTRCGAILATVQDLLDHTMKPSPNLMAIIDRIRPSTQALIDEDPKRSMDQLWSAAVRANIHSAAQQLRDQSKILQGLIAKGKFRIVGAEYCLKTGVVEFFDGRTDPA